MYIILKMVAYFLNTDFLSWCSNVTQLSWKRLSQTQIKTTMRYHFTPVRMAIINKSTNNKYW